MKKKGYIKLKELIKIYQNKEASIIAKINEDEWLVLLRQFRKCLCFSA
jgi:hypothetical protein